MTTNRSAEELTMRTAVIAWGRARWPGCRVMEEFETGGCRADVAFVQETHIAAVEIKSSLDTLDRLKRQIEHFTWCVPEVWVAIAPKWIKAVHQGDSRLPYEVGVIVVADGVVDEVIRHEHWAQPHRALINEVMTVPLLELAHLVELKNIAAAKSLAFRERWTRKQMMRLLARGLTGDEIIAGVCRQLRARPRGWAADEPIAVAA